MDYGTAIKMNRNLLYAGGIGGVLAKVNGTNYNSLLAYTATTGFDAQSKSKQVFFTGANNLRLTGNSLGDVDLAALPRPNLGGDKDFVTRSSTHPYMGCYEGNVPLPVSYLFFKGSVENGDAYLHWATANEQNNKGFYVGRSKDGITFERIGFVPGNGNSMEAKTYTFKDGKAFESDLSWYYQLQQVDENGRVQLSDKIMLSVATLPHDFAVYPNPASTNLFVKMPAQWKSNLRLRIYDLSGKILLEKELGFGLNQMGVGEMNIDVLPLGMFAYKLESGGECLLSGKFVKQ
jgi:hypothetical protein